MKSNNNIKNSIYEVHGIWSWGVSLMRNVSFSKKASLISVLFLVPFIFVSLWLINDEKNALFKAKENELRHGVEIVNSILNWAHSKEKEGMPREEAQKLAVSAINNIRYEKTEYFWVNDLKGIVHAHAFPAQIGKDATVLKDPNGFYFFKEFIKVAQEKGSGLVEYQWPKPNDDKKVPVDKYSYVQLFEPWGWVVGTGVYVDDIIIAHYKKLALVLSIVLIVILICFYFFYSFYLVTKGGLQLVSEHLNELAEGDLRNAPNEPWGKDEPAQLIFAMKKTYAAMHELIENVRGSSKELNLASAEIADANRDLSNRTEQSAANLEQQASAVEEFKSQIFETTKKANTSKNFAEINAESAKKGGEVIANVVNTMEEINESSQKIESIISLIDSIAFQTNILSLNAAIEAARAGEAGRGFAVVANEVGVLAQKTTDAAKEIKVLIEKSVNKVHEGTSVVNVAGETMKEIVENAIKIENLLEEISQNANEQSISITELGKAINELEQHTQQNSALVEETSAATVALKNQASILDEQISHFKL